MPLVSSTERGEGYQLGSFLIALGQGEGLQDPCAESWQPKGQGRMPNFLVVDSLSGSYASVWEHTASSKDNITVFVL